MSTGQNSLNNNYAIWKISSHRRWSVINNYGNGADVEVRKQYREFIISIFFHIYADNSKTNHCARSVVELKQIENQTIESFFLGGDRFCTYKTVG